MKRRNHIPKPEHKRYRGWAAYRLSVGRSCSAEDFWNRRCYVCGGRKGSGKTGSQYGPTGAYDRIEARRHARYCWRYGWVPYETYRERVQAWRDRRTKKEPAAPKPIETPREMAERILRERGLAPRRDAA